MNPRIAGGKSSPLCITGGCALIAGIWAGLAWGHDGSTPLIVAGCVAAVIAVGVAAARSA